MSYRYRRRPDPLLPLLALAGIAALAVSFLRDNTASRGQGATSHGSPKGLAAINPKVAEGSEEVAASNFVRPAGPEGMRDQPRRGWSKVDEASDESFPASDPPGNY